MLHALGGTLLPCVLAAGLASCAGHRPIPELVACDDDVPSVPSKWASKGGVVVGRVTDLSGRAVAGAALKLVPLGGSGAHARPAGSLSAQDGTFLLRHLAPGRYRAHAWALGHAAVTLGVEVTSGGGDTILVRLPRTSACS